MAAHEAGTVVLDGRAIPFEVRRSSRARRVRLVVGPQPRVEIVAPHGEPLGRIKDLLAPYRLWIFRQLEAIAIAATRPERSLDMLPYLGGELQVIVERGNRRLVQLEDRTLRVRILRGERPEPIIISWYREQARALVRDRADHWSAVMGVHYGRISIRDQRGRWGSCSSLGNLNFNWRLVLAPAEVLDYVVIHEVAHLREPNHGPHFWSLVEEWCPEFRRQRAWLQQHGPRLVVVLS